MNLISHLRKPGTRFATELTALEQRPLFLDRMTGNPSLRSLEKDAPFGLFAAEPLWLRRPPMLRLPPAGALPPPNSLPSGSENEKPGMLDGPAATTIES